MHKIIALIECVTVWKGTIIATMSPTAHTRNTPRKGGT